VQPSGGVKLPANTGEERQSTEIEINAFILPPKDWVNRFDPSRIV
jgi:hypothetical protein